MQSQIIAQSLYSISEEFSLTLEELMLSEGEIDENQEKKLSEIQSLLSSKTDSIVGWVKSQEDLIALADQRIKELQAFKAAINSKLDKFDVYANNCMNRLNVSKLEGTLSAIKKRKPTKVVVIHNENEIPLDFIKTPEPKAEIMIQEIGKAIKSGQAVPGASLQDSKKISITYDLK